MSTIKLTPEQKELNRIARKEAREQAKEQARIEEEKNQKEIDEIVISIEWKNSRTWGKVPHCEAEVKYKDGTRAVSPTYKASGCGYDKRSTVIADVFNEYLKYKLWKLGPEALKGGNGSGSVGPAPYGIHVYTDNRPHFGGGIGTNCYYRIADYIGGRFENVSSGKTYDVYKYTDLEAPTKKAE